MHKTPETATLTRTSLTPVGSLNAIASGPPGAQSPQRAAPIPCPAPLLGSNAWCDRMAPETKRVPHRDTQGQRIVLAGQWSF